MSDLGSMMLGASDPNYVPGVVYGEVTKIDDKGLYQVKVSSGQLTETLHKVRLATMMAGGERGSFFAPEVKDEVVVGFELGNITRPVILGALWSDKDKPPKPADTSESNNVRTLVSRSKHQVTLDDTPNAEKITIKTDSGLEITIQEKPTQRITIKTTGTVASSKIELDGVAWNHQHATGTGPSGPPVSIKPVP